MLPVLRADPKFKLRDRAWVSRLSYDKAAKKVTGVIFTDTRTGEEYEQPAGLVVLSAYVFGNISLLLNSGIGEPYDPVTQKGAVGKNYCYQLSRMGVTLFFEDRFFNPFMGSPGTQMVMDDFNGDNFDHSGLGFLGGCKIQLAHADGRPISYRPVPPGTAGAQHGRRRLPNGISTPRASRCRDRTTPTATTTSISIRPIRISSAGRCCA